jgi:hypothetical protein
MPRAFQNPAAGRLKLALTALLVAAVVVLVGLYVQIVGDAHGLRVQLVAALTLAAMVAQAADPVTGMICVRLLRPRRRKIAARFAARGVVVAIRGPRAPRRIGRI